MNPSPNTAGVSALYGVNATGAVYRQNFGKQFSGIFYPISRTSFGDITDGTSNTMMFGEVDCRVPTLTGATSRQGSIWIGLTVSNNTNGILRSMTTVASQKLNSGDMPPTTPAWNTMGSLHFGGANFCRGDGSVAFLSDTIGLIVYEALGTRAEGESVAP